MRKEDNVSNIVDVVMGIFTIIGIIATITMFSSWFSKGNSNNDSTIVLDNDAGIEVCGDIFLFKDYMDGDYFPSLMLSDIINEACEEYFTYNLREEIEEEVREELKEK